jgi:hypothetical protein
MANRAWDTSVWVADTHRVAAALAWSPRHDLARGLELFIEWLQGHPALLEFYRARQSG